MATKQPSSENNNTTAKASLSPAPIITPKATLSPQNMPSMAKKIDITGTWTGTFANRDAILFINNQDGNSFSGI
ncbi:MAG TPA: hypothetical protein VF791_20215 [Pyrinomonadaceae bacterium]